MFELRNGSFTFDFASSIFAISLSENMFDASSICLSMGSRSRYDDMGSQHVFSGFCACTGSTLEPSPH